jgi:hypothetical protein
MKPQSKTKVEVHLLFQTKLSVHELIRIAESQEPEHICIDSDTAAHYLLMKTLLEKGLLPDSIEDKIFGYKKKYPDRVTYIYVNESQHDIFKSILNPSEVCNAKTKESYT